jgi:predicted phage terminase large subunit-like protein
MSKSVDDYLNSVDYAIMEKDYVPSAFAINYVNFIKLVNGTEGESNITPTVHYKWLDQLAGDKKRLANLCSRGFGKTVIFGEYLVLYLALFGEIEGFGKIEGMIYISDSMENGAKSLRKNVEHRYYNSPFMQQYVPKVKFTDALLEFENADGRKLGVRLFGAKTGLRGTKIYGKRPTLAILDDLVSDTDANSSTVMRTIKDTVYKGVTHALDPTKSKIVFSGTPFNKGDILYEAVESGAWEVNVYPICEKFPCSEEEFVGAWEDRFSYAYVRDQYEAAKQLGELASFMQELMLKITNDEDRLILDHDINWYSRATLLANKHSYNFYITTDFATSEKQSADYSVISVWAYNNKGFWFLVDGVCKRQLMDANIDDLFRLAQLYEPQSVGIEVTGQQGGFIQWIQAEMLKRNQWFSLASEGNSNKAGVRPNTNKMTRFNTVVPWFKQGMVFLPEEYRGKHELVTEMEDELVSASLGGFKSKHDDVIDTISMLSVLKPWKPSEAPKMIKDDSGIWEDSSIYEDGEGHLGSYIV